jgi:hypothetical protein
MKTLCPHRAAYINVIVPEKNAVPGFSILQSFNIYTPTIIASTRGHNIGVPNLPIPIGLIIKHKTYRTALFATLIHRVFSFLFPPLQLNVILEEINESRLAAFS